ncbi:MAG: hypothetical protein U1F43_33390 [Myxococcota bacterium]
MIRWAAAVVLVTLVAAACPACTQWLDADDGSDEPELRCPGKPVVYPSAPAELESRPPSCLPRPAARAARRRLDARASTWPTCCCCTPGRRS